MDTQKKVLGLNKDCRDLPYLTGRLMGVVTHYAEKRYGPSTLGEMFKWPKRYIDIFMTYVNKRDPYLKEIAVAPLAKMDTLQQGQAYIGYYHQLAAYDRDEREKHQSITDKLRALRKQRGMTQKELAAKCGTQQQRIAEIESGEFSPTLDTLKPILNALNAELLLKDNSAMMKKYTNGYEAWYIDKHPHGRIFRSEDYCPKADKDESIVLLTEYWSVVVYLKNLIELEEMEAKLKLKVKE